MERINLIQGSEEWKIWRRDKICASDIPTILEKNPYQSPYSLLIEKLEGKEKYVTEAMKEGKIFEETINSDEFEKSLVIQSEIEPRFAASLDLVKLDESSAFVLEIKRTKSPLHEMYELQVLWQLLILKESYDDVRGEVLIYNHVEDELEALEVNYREFTHEEWEKIEGFKLALINKNPKYLYKTLSNELEEKMIELYNEYQEINLVIKELMEKRDAYLAEIKSHGAHATSAYILKEVSRKGSLDEEALKASTGIDLEKFRKKGSHYLTLTKI